MNTLSYKNALEYIFSFSKSGKPTKNLDRIKYLMNILDNPQDKLKFIHVAGTNGKGSVVQMCAEILIDSGYKTGIFTSPYIIEYADRIRINDKNISYDILAEMTAVVKNAISGCPYENDFSQFEITTAIALLYYLKEKCDVVVFETGIGGRVDSTNIINTVLVSVITSVSMDHMNILGNTLAQIASQKAGIIKSKVPCVLSCKNDNCVIDVVKNECSIKNAQFIQADFDDIDIISTDITGSDFKYKNQNYRVNMPGIHQLINAITAINAIEVLNKKDFKITKSSIQNGLSNAKVPARTEVLSNNPLIILDGGHNEDGVKALCNVIRNSYNLKKIIITGMLKTKDYKLCLRELSEISDDFICIDSFHPDSVSSEELSEILHQYGKNVITCHDLSYIIDYLKNFNEKNTMLVICGSLYLASAVRIKYLS